MRTVEQVVESLSSKFDGAILGTSTSRREVYVRVAPERLVDVCGCLVDDFGARFQVSVGTDKMPKDGSLEVSHIFALDEDGLYVTTQVRVDPGNPQVASIMSVVPAANWAEREFRDMVGVSPEGHPDPRRLVLADDWPEGVHPLRKDFKYDYKPPASTGSRPLLKEPEGSATVIPIGPFYPVLEEPAYLRLFVEGEDVVGCDYRGFYNHRGVEKLGDTVLTFNQIPFIAERI